MGFKIRFRYHLHGSTCRGSCQRRCLDQQQTRQVTLPVGKPWEIRVEGWAGKRNCGKLVMYGIILGHLHLRYCGDFSQRVELVSLKRPASQPHNGCIYNLNSHNLGIASTCKPQYLLRNTSELFNTSHYYIIHT